MDYKYCPKRRSCLCVIKKWRNCYFQAVSVSKFLVSECGGIKFTPLLYSKALAFFLKEKSMDKEEEKKYLGTISKNSDVLKISITNVQRVQEQEPKDEIKLIYICSRYRAETPLREDYNRIIARICSRWSAEYSQKPVVAPHLLYTQLWDDKKENEREIGVNLGLKLLAQCNRLFVFVDRNETLGGISSGMNREIQKAKRLNIPIYYFYIDVEDNK